MHRQRLILFLTHQIPPTVPAAISIFTTNTLGSHIKPPFPYSAQEISFRPRDNSQPTPSSHQTTPTPLPPPPHRPIPCLIIPSPPFLSPRITRIHHPAHPVFFPAATTRAALLFYAEGVRAEFILISMGNNVEWIWRC